MNQSSNIYCSTPHVPHHPSRPCPCHHCPRPLPEPCPCQCECECHCHPQPPTNPCPCNDDENYYCRPTCPCAPCPCACESACECYDPENYYCKPNTCAPQCGCQDMASMLSRYIGKRVIICVNGTRMRVILCEICGTFVKALAYGCGKTLYINMCKIDDVKVSC